MKIKSESIYGIYEVEYEIYGNRNSGIKRVKIAEFERILIIGIYTKKNFTQKIVKIEEVINSNKEFFTMSEFGNNYYLGNKVIEIKGKYLRTVGNGLEWDNLGDLREFSSY